MFGADRVLQELEVLGLGLVWEQACWQAQSETMAQLLADVAPE